MNDCKETKDQANPGGALKKLIGRNDVLLQIIGLSIVATGLALGIDLAIDKYLLLTPPRRIGAFNQISVALYFTAVLVSSLYGGFRCGLFTLMLADVLNLFFFWNGHFSLAGGVYGADRIVLINGISGVAAWMAGKNRKSQEELRRLNDELEKRVHSRTAALEETNRQLETFCYSLAHDLRAPLRSMQGFSLALIEDHSGQLDSTGRDYAQRILTSSQAMGELIQDLLAYTQLSQAELLLEEIDLQWVVEQAIRVYSADIKGRGASVIIEATLPKAVGHLATAELVMLHLLSNALRFTKETPRVRFWAEESPKTVRVWIEDNGIGISPEHRERLFGLFTRLHSAEAYPGSGVGLALSKKGVEQMGGRIGLLSTPGKGSQFWVELQKAGKQA